MRRTGYDVGGRVTRSSTAERCRTSCRIGARWRRLPRLERLADPAAAQRAIRATVAGTASCRATPSSSIATSRARTAPTASVVSGSDGVHLRRGTATDNGGNGISIGGSAVDVVVADNVASGTGCRARSPIGRAVLSRDALGAKRTSRARPRAAFVRNDGRGVAFRMRQSPCVISKIAFRKARSVLAGLDPAMRKSPAGREASARWQLAGGSIAARAARRGRRGSCAPAVSAVAQIRM